MPYFQRILTTVRQFYCLQHDARYDMNDVMTGISKRKNRRVVKIRGSLELSPKTMYWHHISPILWRPGPRRRSEHGNPSPRFTMVNGKLGREIASPPPLAMFTALFSAAGGRSVLADGR